jgi:outer membrane protein OmpA-like peptidoglycan-associated protein
MSRRKGRSVGDVARYTGTSSTPPSFRDQREDEPLTSGVTFGLISFAVFAAICFAAVHFGTASIENDLERRTTAALRAAGFESVEVDAAGTTVSISGTFVTGQDEDDAYDAVASVAGVGDVEGQIWPVSTDDLTAPVVRGAPLEATWVNGDITITGDVSTEDKRDFIALTLDQAIVEEGSVIRSYDLSGVTVLEGLPDESAWLGSVLALLKTAPGGLPVGLLRVDGANEYIVVSGDVLEKATRDELNAKVVETAEALGFDANPAVRLLDEGPTEEEVQDLQDDLNEVILDQVVEFEVDSFALTDRGRVVLDEVLATLEGAPDDIRVLISGHTDDRGSTAENQLLSEQRAKAVLDYLVAAGQDEGRFDTVGYGETKPIASNDTEEGRARNRRIEFTALLEESP